MIKFLSLLALIPLLAFSEIPIVNYLKDIEITHKESGLLHVDCIYIINLEKRLEKWQEVSLKLESFGIYPNRVDAINGWKLSEKDKEALIGPYPMRFRGGEIGCILSHVSTLQDAFKRGYEIIWVCEDDIAIYENPHEISSWLVKLTEIDPNWDVFYTDPNSKDKKGVAVPSIGADFRPDYSYKDLSYYQKRTYVHDNLLHIGQRFGAYSMLISKRGIQKILTHFLNNYLWTAYDIEVHYVPKLRQYCLDYDLISIDYTKNSDTARELD